MSLRTRVERLENHLGPESDDPFGLDSLNYAELIELNRSVLTTVANDRRAPSWEREYATHRLAELRPTTADLPDVVDQPKLEAAVERVLRVTEMRRQRQEAGK